MMAIELLAAAAADVQDAFRWYEHRRVGLGAEFIGCLDAALAEIQRAPDAQHLVHRDVRRKLMRRFPYGVFYRREPTRILVVAVFHCSQSPSLLKKRA